MTPLRQRMIDAMVLRGFSPRTQQSYADAIYGMAKHYRRDPAQYTAQEVEAYLLHMVQERHLSYSTMNQAACAARFLYEKVLGRERELFPSPWPKCPPGNLSCWPEKKSPACLLAARTRYTACSCKPCMPLACASQRRALYGWATSTATATACAFAWPAAKAGTPATAS